LSAWLRKRSRSMDQRVVISTVTVYGSVVICHVLFSPLTKPCHIRVYKSYYFSHDW